MIKIIFKRLGYWQVQEIPYDGNSGLDLAIALARILQYNGAEFVHITR